MGLAVAYLRPPVGGPIPEALVPEPAFEIFRVDTDVVGGRLVQVMPQARLQLSRSTRCWRRSRREHAWCS